MRCKEPYGIEFVSVGRVSGGHTHDRDKRLKKQRRTEPAVCEAERPREDGKEGE